MYIYFYIVYMKTYEYIYIYISWRKEIHVIQVLASPWVKVDECYSKMFCFMT